MSSAKRRLFYICVYIFLFSGACFVGYHDIGLSTLPLSAIVSTYALFTCTASFLHFRLNRVELDLVFSVSGMNILMSGICIWLNAWVAANIAIIAVTLLHVYFQMRNYKKYNRKLPVVSMQRNYMREVNAEEIMEDGYSGIALIGICLFAVLLVISGLVIWWARTH